MKRFLSIAMLMLLGAPLAGAKDLSPERLDELDKRGYFTPDFKAATHGLVDALGALNQAEMEEKTLRQQLPSLQKQAAETEAKAVALRQELAKYDHPEENDFTALQSAMSDSVAQAKDQVILAQAYVWAYPMSPHAAEAQQFLQQVHKKIADEQQAAKDAEAARIAAHAKLVARGQAHDLSLLEWRELLRGMSQTDLVKLLGQPSSQKSSYWFYTDGWVNEPAQHGKVGMQINFEAGRVITVDEKPPTP